MEKRLMLLCGAAFSAAACFPEKLAQPKCTAKPFTTASVSVDTITTTTGLRYIPGAPGAGSDVTWCTNVAVHYEAYLADGTLFDETRSTAVPLAFTPGVGGLIDGFEQGVIGMRSGGKRRLIIPSSLGFGDQPRKDATGKTIVPGGSTVIYDIEVVEVGIRPAQ